MKKLLTTSLLAISLAALVHPVQASSPLDDSQNTLDLYNPSHRIQWRENHDDVIVSQLQNQGILPQDIIEKKVIDIVNIASNCKRVLTVKDGDGKEYVIKQMASHHLECYSSGYNKEKKLAKKGGDLERYVNLIKTYESQEDVRLPVLTTYYGLTTVEVAEEMLPVVVMAKVKGKSLKDFIDSFSDASLNQDPDFILRSVEMGKIIGEQMGQLTRAFLTMDKSILRHPDPSENNFFYDESTQQFSWIDLTALKTYSAWQPKDLYNAEVYMMKEIWWSFFPFHARDNFTTCSYQDRLKGNTATLKTHVEEKGITALAHHRVGILTANAFIGAYIKQVKDLDHVKAAQQKDKTFQDLNKTHGVTFILDTVESLKNDYVEKVKEAFGAESDTVLEYLFSMPSSKE